MYASRSFRTRCSVVASAGFVLAALLLPMLPTAPVAATATAASWSPGGCASRVLPSAATRSCVVLLQQRLIALHYDLAGVDGYYGSQTRHAVIAFQKVNGLRRDGVVGSATWARLARPVVPTLRYVRAGSALEVNLSKQVLYRAAGGRIYGIYDVSTGRAIWPTPVSNGRPMHIYRKVLWGTTMGTDTEHYVQYFARSRWLLAIHEYYNVPTYPASHGCIRVPPGSAGRLYARTFVGEALYTYY